MLLIFFSHSGVTLSDFLRSSACFLGDRILPMAISRRAHLTPSTFWEDRRIEGLKIE
jgi:hypothetical protein